MNTTMIAIKNNITTWINKAANALYIHTSEDAITLLALIAGSIIAAHYATGFYHSEIVPMLNQAGAYLTDFTWMQFQADLLNKSQEIIQNVGQILATMQ